MQKEELKKIKKGIEELEALIKKSNELINKYENIELVSYQDYNALRNSYVKLIDSAKTFLSFNFIDFNKFEETKVEIDSNILRDYLSKQKIIEENLNKIRDLNSSFIYRRFLEG
jgi:hypothetical protein